jgi:hypothetical protein
MARLHDPYCERSAAVGEGFPDLIGGVIGLAIGLTRGGARTARRLVEDAIWMDAGGADQRADRCGCCHPVHRVVISDCGPCAPYSYGCGCQ